MEVKISVFGDRIIFENYSAGPSLYSFYNVNFFSLYQTGLPYSRIGKMSFSNRRLKKEG